MTPGLVRQLEMLKGDWTKYKPTGKTESDSKTKMLGWLNESIEVSMEEILNQKENQRNAKGEMEQL